MMIVKFTRTDGTILILGCVVQVDVLPTLVSVRHYEGSDTLFDLYGDEYLLRGGNVADRFIHFWIEKD